MINNFFDPRSVLLNHAASLVLCVNPFNGYQNRIFSTFLYGSSLSCLFLAYKIQKRELLNSRFSRFYKFISFFIYLADICSIFISYKYQIPLWVYVFCCSLIHLFKAFHFIYPRSLDKIKDLHIKLCHLGAFVLLILYMMRSIDSMFWIL